MDELGPRRPYSGYAIASFVMGLVGTPIPIPFLGPILAIRWAKRAEHDIYQRAPYARGLGLAKAGRILGYIGLILSVLWFVVLLQIYYQRVVRPPGP